MMGKNGQFRSSAHEYPDPDVVRHRNVARGYQEMDIRRMRSRGSTFGAGTAGHSSLPFSVARFATGVDLLEIEHLRAERDLYLRLLELNHEDDIRTFLQQALALLTSVARATRGYIEISAPNQVDAPTFWITQGTAAEEADEFQKRISRGVIAKALASGETVVTASAVADPRFRDHESVQRQKIEAVLCAPIGSATPIGVLYLQGREEHGPFTSEDRRRSELCARHLGPLAERLLLRWREGALDDSTLQVRQGLSLPGVIGTSPALAKLLEQIRLVAPLEVSVLLTGETGTGKTQFARIIHQNSKRSSGPFVELNCAAIQDSLLENELFGAERGAHSAALRSQAGKVQAAEGGTLFLDEVGELSPAAQAKLLQLLQSKTYYPLGAAASKVANVRVLAATNADLKDKIADRTFREDLYFRLHVLPVHVPALRERRTDIVGLAQYFCQRTCEENGFRSLKLSHAALQAASTAEWPGNVRELSNAVQAATIRASAEGVGQIEARHIFPEASQVAASPTQTYQEATRRFQKQFVRETLRSVAWNVPDAARQLDVARSYLYALIKTHGIERE
jgi:Nif-specific regulatory protein